MPSVVLKKMVISGFDKRAVDSDIADAIDFMVDKVLGNTSHYLASCHSYFQYVRTTIMRNGDLRPTTSSFIPLFSWRLLVKKYWHLD